MKSRSAGITPTNSVPDLAERASDTLGNIALVQSFSRLEAEVAERDALAGGGEQRPVLGVAKRAKALGIPQYRHIAHGVEKDKIVGAVKAPAQIAEDLHQIGTLVLASLLPCRGAAAVGVDHLTNVAIAMLFFLHGAKLSREAVIADGDGSLSCDLNCKAAGPK